MYGLLSCDRCENKDAVNCLVKNGAGTVASYLCIKHMEDTQSTGRLLDIQPRLPLRLQREYAQQREL